MISAAGAGVPPAVLGSDPLLGGFVGSVYGLVGWNDGLQHREALGRRQAAESRVGAAGVVELEPVRDLIVDVRRGEVWLSPELIEDGSLRPLDLAVQVRRAGADRSELDLPCAQLILDPVGEELLSAIGLHPLDGKRQFDAGSLKKGERVGGGLPHIERGQQPSGAVVHSRVLYSPGAILQTSSWARSPGTGRA